MGRLLVVEIVGEGLQAAERNLGERLGDVGEKTIDAVAVGVRGRWWAIVESESDELGVGVDMGDRLNIHRFTPTAIDTGLSCG